MESAISTFAAIGGCPKRGPRIRWRDWWVSKRSHESGAETGWVPKEKHSRYQHLRRIDGCPKRGPKERPALGRLNWIQSTTWSLEKHVAAKSPGSPVSLAGKASDRAPALPRASGRPRAWPSPRHASNRGDHG